MDLTVAGERLVLEGMLEHQRTAIAELLDGIDDAEARLRLVPSMTVPLSLVTHATFVEQVWFHSRVAGVDRADLGLPDSPEESFVLDPDDTIASVRQAYLDACAGSREVAAGRDLESIYDWRGRPVNLRFIYTHMIAELARHAGHGDILVEQIVARR